MVRPGDVVIADFPGAMLAKVRPMVVISSSDYHKERPDAIISILTSNIASAIASSDFVLQDWKLAGLRKPSAFRSFLGMESQSSLHVIGHLSPRDWQGVLAAIRRAIA
jgi:mRNA interferase MazF